MTDATSGAAGKKYYWFFFLALTLFYLSFTPGTIKGMGYNLESLTAANQIATDLLNAVQRRPPAPVNWPRHGVLELLFELPFVLASRLAFGDSLDWAGRVTAIQPVLATSLSCAVLFLWATRLTKNLAWGFWLSATAGVATMLWPYASIGLETTQSLFLILSAYMALSSEAPRTWGNLFCFSLCCAIAVSVKTNGVFLLPAVAYLMYCYFFQRGKSWVGALRPAAPKALLAVVIVAGVYAVNRHYSSKYWSGGYNSSSGYFMTLLVGSPLRMAFQFLSYFGSVNKSLFLYAPLTAPALFSLPRAYRSQPRVAAFACLCLAGMAGGFSLTYMWADETWGPRYLHESILPLAVCFASTRVGPEGGDTGLRWRKAAPLLAAAVLGVAISFLGSFFYYGSLHLAAMRVSQPALESLQHDPRMNHIEFNAKLMKIWLKGRAGGADNPEEWPAHYNWWFQKPPDGPQEKTVDLREFAIPLPLLAKGWEKTYSLSLNQYRAARLFLFGSLSISLALFLYLAVSTARRPVRGPAISTSAAYNPSGH
jgi:hypothetical protein